ncbi:MAG: L,D-transpeptidase [Candidatus Eremiobacteraeota bacterium]|nr:L,D-transpeptidase [Candidatus Eremiobacteraeota bacterium]
MKKHKIYIDLSNKKFYLLDNNDDVILSFPIIYGRNSHLGNKEKEGDQRTPRGEFYICSRNEKSKFKLFLGISYPTEEDAKRGYDNGLINKKQRDEIINAHKHRKRPPWNTSLGGEIGIHGGGIDRDGTRGCIAMRNEDVMKLGEYVDVGDVVIMK